MDEVLKDRAYYNDLQSRTITWLRFPLMLLIVLVHTDDQVMQNLMPEGISKLLYTVILTLTRCALPLFFVISGYFFFFNKQGDAIFDCNVYKRKLKTRIKTLLIPYLFWNYLIWAIGLSVTVLQGHADWIQRSEFYPLNLLDVVVGWTDGYSGMPKAFQLWFLRDLMFLCVCSMGLYQLLKNNKFWVLIPMAVIYLLPWHENWPFLFRRLPLALFFFSLGASLSINNINLVQFCKRIPSYFSLTITLALFVLHVCAAYYQLPYVDLVQKIFRAVSIVVVLQIVSSLIEKDWLKPNNFLAQASFMLFVLHPTIIKYCATEIFMNRISPSSLHFWLYYLWEIVVSVLVCTLLYYILCKYCPKFAAIITGRKYEPLHHK